MLTFDDNCNREIMSSIKKYTKELPIKGLYCIND